MPTDETPPPPPPEFPPSGAPPVGDGPWRITAFNYLNSPIGEAKVVAYHVLNNTIDRIWNEVFAHSATFAFLGQGATRWRIEAGPDPAAPLTNSFAYGVISDGSVISEKSGAWPPAPAPNGQRSWHAPDAWYRVECRIGTQWPIIGWFHVRRDAAYGGRTIEEFRIDPLSGFVWPRAGDPDPAALVLPATWDIHMTAPPSAGQLDRCPTVLRFELRDTPL